MLNKASLMTFASWTQSHVYLLVPVSHSVLNKKALVCTFNQEKALIGAFSVIAKSSRTFINLRFKLYNRPRTATIPTKFSGWVMWVAWSRGQWIPS